MDKTFQAFAAAQRLLDAVECAGYNLFSYRDIDSIISYGQTYFPSFMHCDWGASRLVIWDDEYDFVIKVAIDKKSEKYNQHEVEVYAAAEKEGLQNNFGWCKCFIEPEGDEPGIYVMEFLGDGEDSWDNYVVTEFRKETGDNNSEIDVYDMEDEEVIRYFTLSMSEKEAAAFRVFTQMWNVTDLHTGNIRHCGNRFVFCDYAGWNWQEENVMKVLISKGFGAGWSTWGHKEMAIDQDLVRLFERGCTEDEMKALCIKKGYTSLFGGDPYMGGFEDLVVEEVPAGCYFKIREYDGSEYIEVFDSSSWFFAEN